MTEEEEDCGTRERKQLLIWIVGVTESPCICEIITVTEYEPLFGEVIRIEVEPPNESSPEGKVSGWYTTETETEKTIVERRIRFVDLHLARFTVLNQMVNYVRPSKENSYWNADFSATEHWFSPVMRTEDGSYELDTLRLGDYVRIRGLERYDFRVTRMKLSPDKNAAVVFMTSEDADVQMCYERNDDSPVSQTLVREGLLMEGFYGEISKVRLKKKMLFLSDEDMV